MKRGDRLALAADAANLKAQGMNGLQIADALGISKAYAYDLLADPSGVRMRVRKASYDQVCVDCGARASGTDGPRAEPRCRDCGPAFASAERMKRDMQHVPAIPGLLPVWDKDGVADFARVDIADWETLRSKRWVFAAKKYVASSKESSKVGALRYLHHHIVGHVKRESGLHTDHINRDPTDNRRHNLRIVTPAVNMANRGGVLDAAKRINPADAAEARRAGESVASIAERCDVSRQSVYRALRAA